MSTSPSHTLTEVLLRELAGRVALSPQQLLALEAHYGLLLRWNERMSLTTVTKLPEAATRHYGESLLLGTLIDGSTVADVGSGAGFPGIPAAILRPELRFDLVESHQKKAVFLKEATRALPNVRVLAIRAESLTVRYDWIVSRAVEPSSVLALRNSMKFGLLVGESDAEAMRGASVTPLPWGDRRVIAILER